MSSLDLLDYHLHTAVTIDGRMNEVDACEKAVSMGIQEIAFTNHLMLNHPDYKISPAAFIEHWNRLQACMQRFPKLTLRLGLEMDYYLGREAEISATLEAYQDLIGRPFDFVLGSIHEIDGGFYSRKIDAPMFFNGRDLVGLYRRYFELAAQAARSGLFNVIAHPDLIKKYTNDLTPPIPFTAYASSAADFIEALISTGIGLEVNTKGLKLPVGEAYPSDELLSLYLQRNNELGKPPMITLGSDAHKVEEVGFKIAETARHLYSLGVRHLSRFEHGKNLSLIVGDGG